MVLKEGLDPCVYGFNGNLGWDSDWNPLFMLRRETGCLFGSEVQMFTSASQTHRTHRKDSLCRILYFCGNVAVETLLVTVIMGCSHVSDGETM